MSGDNIKNIAASIHARLQNCARQMEKPFQEVLQYYGIERFLYRLSKTQYSNRFVLKGGLVFYCLGLPLRRPTRDIDLRAYTSNSPTNLAELTKAICLCPVPEDGLVYHASSIQIHTITPTAEYQGLRINCLSTLGRSIIPLQIDIGFSDEIVPGSLEIQYPTLLQEMERPILRCYSRESIVSEKYHAMVYLDELNSRLKDFYDIWMLSELFDFDGQLLSRAIETTFRNRKTELTLQTPSAFSDDYVNSHKLMWEKFLSKNNIPVNEGSSFSLVIEKVRKFIQPPVIAMVTGQQFSLCWKAGEGWI